MISILAELGWPNVAMIVVVAGIVLYDAWRKHWVYRRDGRRGRHLTWRRG